MGIETSGKIKNPRVCVVSPLYHPSRGGIGKQAQLLTEELAESDAIAFVIARRMKGMPPAEFKPGLMVLRAWSIKPELHNFEEVRAINILISLTFSISCALLLMAKRKDYDVVHFHGASLPLFFNLPLLKALGKKVVAKVAAANVGTEAGSLRGRYLGLGNLLAGLARLADGFVATTSEIEEGLLSDGIAAQKINRIPNFIDFTYFSPPSEVEKSGLRKKVGFGKERIVLFSGRFIERKGVAFLLRAWRSLQDDFPDVRLILVGDGPLLPGMRNLAEQIGIAKSVEFRGHVGNVKEHLQASDLFVISSLQEGMPNSLLEAMACGLPPLATRIGGIEDIVQDGVNGILVEPADPENLAQGLRKLLADEELARNMAAKAWTTIRDNFSLDGVIPKYISLYRSLGSA